MVGTDLALASVALRAPTLRDAAVAREGKEFSCQGLIRSAAVIPRKSFFERGRLVAEKRLSEDRGGPGQAMELATDCGPALGIGRPLGREPPILKRLADRVDRLSTP